MLKVHNSSDKKITILYSNVEPPPPTQNEIAFYVSEGQAIAPDSINTIFRAGKPDAWHRYIEKGFDKRLFVYVFDVDTLVGYNGIYTMNELISMHKY